MALGGRAGRWADLPSGTGGGCEEDARALVEAGLACVTAPHLVDSDSTPRPPPPRQGDETNTYARIVGCDVQFPDHVSSEARDLINSLLVREPDARLSLSGVMRHPWIKMHAPPAAVEEQGQAPAAATSAEAAAVRIEPEAATTPVAPADARPKTPRSTAAAAARRAPLQQPRAELAPPPTVP